MPADRAQSKRKPRPSLRARENRAPTHSDTPPTSRSRNRLPPAVEEVDLTSDMPVDLESNTKVSKRALKPQESSPTKYLLSFEVLVDNTRVGGRSWLQMAGEFDFAGFSRDEAQKRGRVERTGQTEFAFGSMTTHDPSLYFQSLRERYTSRARATILDLIQSKKRLPYDKVWAEAVRFPLTWENDLKEWLRDLECTGDWNLPG